ncbi:class I SAM-dependent methyltransferase [Rhizobium rhizogenes]|uniref:class I SAM-dependent methyltransferase n=1 Tax=Rhizobium rhizogenes TaxID=359 RepID=UPI00226DF004|nr:class I SAM-dependent methyltransferase [Rhizobium rhizogenes]
MRSVLSKLLPEDAVLSAEAAYDRAAPFYDGWKWQIFWRKAELPYIIDGLQMLGAFRGTASILDVGCGTGYFLNEIGPRFGQAAGIDVSDRMLARAYRRAPQHLFQKADARGLPFAEQSFDVVLCTRVLSHIDRFEIALAEIKRALRPGGLLVMSNVDADHAYVHTKLPTASGSVFAHTVKHSRQTIERECEQFGLRKLTGARILGDGEVERDAQTVRSLAGVVGWTSFLVSE